MNVPLMCSSKQNTIIIPYMVNFTKYIMPTKITQCLLLLVSFLYPTYHAFGKMGNAITTIKYISHLMHVA